MRGKQVFAAQILQRGSFYPEEKNKLKSIKATPLRMLIKFSGKKNYYLIWNFNLI